MIIDEKTIKEMASWVRVRISDEQATEMAADFTETLGWIGEKLKNPELDGVEPMVTPFDEVADLRTDLVTDGDKIIAVLSNAPDATDEFFAVPKMVE